MAEGKVIIADQTLQQSGGTVSTVEFVDIDPSGYSALELIVNTRTNDNSVSYIYGKLKITLGTASGYLASTGTYSWFNLFWRGNDSNPSADNAGTNNQSNLTGYMESVAIPTKYGLPSDEIDNRGCYASVLFTGVQAGKYTACMGKSGFTRGRTHGDQSGFSTSIGTVMNNNDATTKIKLQTHHGSPFDPNQGLSSFMLVGWTNS
jgi:hypothetical protein|tara:strand:- start:807 stop:1421 length:615 start_codon:yes stop_codon:yes gene_type:complete